MGKNVLRLKPINSIHAAVIFLKLFPYWRQLLSSADNLYKQFGPRLGPMFWQSDGVWKNFLKRLILKKSADDNKSMNNYLACKEFKKKSIYKVYMLHE